MRKYDDEVRLEQVRRNLVYLDQPELVAGFRLNNVTPRILAVLTAISSPFICGGEYNASDVAKFLWVCSVDYVPGDTRTRDKIIKIVGKADYHALAAEIIDFVEATFQDSIGGGSSEKSIASSIAWLVYMFRREPWFFTEEQTLDTPLRKLYQEINVHRKLKGETVMNRSDKIKADWLQAVEDAIASGEMTREEFQEALEKANAK